jgi:polyether ionophore transport system permease protein
MTGLWQLTRFSLRRSRILIGVWTAALALLCYASAAATGPLYATTAERVAAARSINASSALVALYGPILDVHSLGEISMTKTTVTYGMLVMALCIALVRRHTRVEEESGRAELLGALAVDSSTPLVSAVLVGAITATLVGVTGALADVAGGLPVGGSLWFGASWWGLGLVGTGIGALTAQLSPSARTCGTIAAGIVAVLFLLRAIGDTSVSWLSWLTPLGWSTQLRAWSAPRGWLVLLDLALAAGLVGAALLVRSRRDLGSGLLAERPGPESGSPRLASALALNLRVHSTSLLVWSVASAVVGALLAAIIPGAESMLDTAGAREYVERLGGVGALQQTLVAAFVAFVAIGISCFALTVVTHGGVEEHDGRTEEVLATATGRSTTFLAVGLVALGGAAWLLLVTGVGMAIGATGSSVSFGGVLAASLVQIPAVWLVGGLALLGLAQGSRWAMAGWVVLAAFFLMGPLAELLQLPGWVAGLSPYSHVSKVPAETLSVLPELWLTALAALVVATAWWRYRERDIG